MAYLPLTEMPHLQTTMFDAAVEKFMPQHCPSFEALKNAKGLTWNESRLFPFLKHSGQRLH